MWRCSKCQANLLEGTRECPVCRLPAETAAVVQPVEIEATSKFWLWLLIGILLPPLGLIMLLVLLLSPKESKQPSG